MRVYYGASNHPRVWFLTERQCLADERERETQVQVASHQHRPHVTLSAAGARTQHQQPERQAILHLEGGGYGQTQLWKLEISL